MEFDLSKPQKLLRETARATLAQACPFSRVRELMASDTTHDGSLWQTIADQGWIGLHLDERYGGLGLGLVELVVVAEEMGRACLPAPYLSNLWAATLLSFSANPRSTALVESIISGLSSATVALLDQDCDWDLDQIQTQLVPTSSGYLVSGNKTAVLDAESTDVILCVVRFESELAVVSIPVNADGIRMRKTRGIDATRSLCDVTLDKVSISKDDIVAVGSEACETIEYSTRVATLMACAETLGAMQWIREATLEYAKTRKQFDRTIGSYQAVQHQCADMLLMTESARSATYYAAWALTAKAGDANKAVAIAKAYCSDMGREVAHRGVQIHAGIGFTWEHNIHLFLKRIKVCEFLFGDATFQREQIAKEILAVMQ